MKTIWYTSAGYLLGIVMGLSCAATRFQSEHHALTLLVAWASAMGMFALGVAGGRRDARVRESDKLSLRR